jgi:hypothetical protein
MNPPCHAVEICTRARRLRRSDVERAQLRVVARWMGELLDRPVLDLDAADDGGGGDCGSRPRCGTAGAGRRAATWIGSRWLLS